MISFLQLRYFMVVADSRSFSSAAKQLYISQQTLSAHIAQMEADLGVILFERTRPLTLTAAGEQLYQRTDELLFLHRQLEQEMWNFSEGECQNLRIGIASSYARTLLPQIFPDLMKKCPYVKLELYERNFSDLSELLQKHKVDMIMTRPPYPNNTVAVPVLEETISIYAPMVSLENMFHENAQEVALALSRSAEIELLKECPFILPRSGSVRDSCNELFRRHQITPRIVTETDFLETAIAFCRAGMGITLSPTGMLQDLTRQSSAEEPLGIYPINERDTRRSLAICYLDRAVVSRSMQQFISIAKAKLGQHAF